MSIFISDKPDGKEAARQEFERVGLNINCVVDSIYLGPYFGPKEDIEA